jgi:uncharacterized lipoprotein YajG
METRKLSRREMLKVLGLGAAGTLLAACGAPPATEAPATKAPEAAAPTATAAPAPAGPVKVTMCTYPYDDI